MKKLFLPLFLVLLVSCFAQQDPEEIITDFGIDEFIYVPKSTLNFGVRYMTGAKVSFAAKPFVLGSLAPAGDGTPGDPSSFTPNVKRQYDNGSAIYPTTDTFTLVNSDGTTSTLPRTTPDGYTNTWYYANSNQVTADGNIAMKSYAAAVGGMDTEDKKAGAGTGVELTVTKDFGKLFGTGIRWGFTAGASLSDIHSSIKQRQMVADITTLTDTYSLNGATAPTAPYTGPTNTYAQAKDADGNLLWDDPDTKLVPTLDYTQPVDTSVLLSNAPINRDISTVTGDETLVTSSFLLKGSYYTIRAGPTFYIPLTEKFRISISAGVAAIYSGTNYRVVTVFTPADDAPITQDLDSDKSKLMIGYYVDANLEYTFTEATGLYVGAVYQTSGSYDQSIKGEDGQDLYTTHIDLKQLQGLRAGMTYKF